ncbi:MAG TPA: ATP-binding protein [Verrucomicrobiae bacterium]|jgi:hypothetical protein|nr:ATP-binding protein [Verrucomicrobiae bacterium]
MSEAPAKPSWVEGNQAYLVAEFARLKSLLDSKTPGGNVEEARRAMEGPAAIDRLAELFELSAFERDILLLCAGVEMDSRLAARCGEVLGNQQRGRATFGLALALLKDPHWSALTPFRPLRHFRLVTVEPGYALTSAPLLINERVLHFMAGINLLDSQLQPLIRLSPAPEWIAGEHKALAAQVAAFQSENSAKPRTSPLIHLCGNDPQGQEDIAAYASQMIGLQLFVVDSTDLPPVGLELNSFIRLWQREAMLLRGALLIQGELSQAASHLAEHAQGCVFLASHDPVRLTRAFVRFDVEKPNPAEQKKLWINALGDDAPNLNGTLDRLSEQFRLSAKTIFVTGALQPDDLWNACRSYARPKLEDLAQRIVPVADWDDLILPDQQKEMLRQLAAQVRHRLRVYETWGFATKGSRGLGVSALFTGESGAGKTMAAEVLARQLKLDLYRIDLAAVVSKYIGETEKNLKRVFDAAEEGGALLLFDEADALFGKRGEINDSRDRYANIEVGYLLQRIEAYQGLAILTTNLKACLDRAFHRRLRFTVNFPFPDAAQRELIWNRIFPSKTPTRNLDTKRLAQLNVTGGNIRNIAVNAAFLAAEDGGPVEMSHLLHAARLETQKIERSLSEAEIKGWV